MGGRKGFGNALCCERACESWSEHGGEVENEYVIERRYSSQ